MSRMMLRSFCHFNFLYILSFLLLISQLTHCFEYELTFIVGAGNMECFYQPIDQSQAGLEVDYQVLDGRDNDINFYLKDPSNKYIRTDQRRRSGTHELTAVTPGTYELCFDNRYSRMTEKMVFFSIYCEADDKSFVNSDRAAEQAIASKTEAAAEQLEITVEQFMMSTLNVQRNVERTKSVQGYLRAHMKSDRSIQESNYTRVNQFSGFYMFAMVTVSIVQVMMIRSLFIAPTSKAPMKVST